MDSFILNLFANPNFLTAPLGVVIFSLLTMWALAWKGASLWHASKGDEKLWFIVLLFVNTFGLLEMAYMFYFSKKKITPNEARANAETFFRNLKELAPKK